MKWLELMFGTGLALWTVWPVLAGQMRRWCR